MTTFDVFRLSVQLGALTQRSVHPALPDLLTKHGPLGVFHELHKKKILFQRHFIKLLVHLSNVEFFNTAYKFNASGTGIMV